ncbi:hypothetical protein ZWY2020_023386 [Hordeum vulgare]|nr:hypothetical protein ZWY2020_023386 [Hordeum vulgare]
MERGGGGCWCFPGAMWRAGHAKQAKQTNRPLLLRLCVSTKTARWTDCNNPKISSTARFLWVNPNSPRAELRPQRRRIQTGRLTTVARRLEPAEAPVAAALEAAFPEAPSEQDPAIMLNTAAGNPATTVLALRWFLENAEVRNKVICSWRRAQGVCIAALEQNRDDSKALYSCETGEPLRNDPCSVLAAGSSVSKFPIVLASVLQEEEPFEL